MEESNKALLIIGAFLLFTFTLTLSVHMYDLGYKMNEKTAVRDLEKLTVDLLEKQEFNINSKDNGANMWKNLTELRVIPNFKVEVLNSKGNVIEYDDLLRNPTSIYTITNKEINKITVKETGDKMYE